MKIGNIKKVLLPNLPYLFFLWAFLKIGTAYRLAEGADFAHKLIGLGRTIGPAFADFAPGLHPFDWLVGIAGAVILRLVVYAKAKKASKYRRDEEYGSARWGTEKDIKPFVDPKFENNIILTKTEFLTMNTRPKNPANARNLNACVIGSSGSGKTRFWLTPQLLQAHSSYVVVDPKGGTLSQVGYFLQRKKGYKVKVFNSIDFSKSMHYNPLAYVRNEADILKFVDTLISNTKGEGKESDPFWTKAETLLYCALIAYIIFEGPPEDRNINTLVDMIGGMEVKENDEDYMNAVDYMFAGLEKRKPDCFAVKQYKKYKLASGKTAKSILISCGARLAPFDIPQLREIMAYDELELDKIGDRKTAVFFLISDTTPTYNFLVALAFSQMFNLLCERADNKYGGRLPHHVRVLWDEAANTGQVPNLEKLVAVIRSREVSLTLFYQQLAQCKAIYDKHAETILGNMDSVIFLGGREGSTIKEISETWLGKATIYMQTDGRSKGQSESYNLNTQRLGRELMTPSELATMPGDRCILQLRGLPPFYSPKYDLKQHPNYKFTEEAEVKPMATIKHISSKNADYGAAEAYLTFEHDEFTMKPTLDEAGRLIPRQDYRLDTLNCGDEDFALSCIRANLRYGKNSKREDIKSHHYIISFDPRDAADNGLTVDRAQMLGLAYCKEHFPGHQALVCTHPDGHNHSGNIHVHIVINSLRIAEVERKPYMDRASDTRAGDKHRCTAAAMRYFRSEVMEMCHREGLYQIDLLNGSKNRVTEREYWAKRKGQAKLDKENAALLAEGITPRQTKFETDKDRLRQTIRQALSTAASFDEFSALLLREGVTVKESRGRLSYLTPDRTKPITARKLGTDFNKAAVLAVFQQNAHRTVAKTQDRQEHQPQLTKGIQRTKPAQITPNPDGPQRFVDIAAKRSEGKGIGYERWAKTFNLKQMAKTMNFLSEHGFTSPEEVDTALEAAISGQHAAGEKLKELESRITANKELMHQISVYRRTKPTHDGLKTAKKPERYREAFHADLTLYEAAVRYFRERGLKKLPAASGLQAENEALISEKNGLYTEYREQKARAAELQKVKSNLAAMLRQERTKEVRRDWER